MPGLKPRKHDTLQTSPLSMQLLLLLLLQFVVMQASARQPIPVGVDAANNVNRPSLYVQDSQRVRVISYHLRHQRGHCSRLRQRPSLPASLTIALYFFQDGIAELISRFHAVVCTAGLRPNFA